MLATPASTGASPTTRTPRKARLACVLPWALLWGGALLSLAAFGFLWRQNAARLETAFVQHVDRRVSDLRERFGSFRGAIGGAPRTPGAPPARHGGLVPGRRSSGVGAFPPGFGFWPGFRECFGASGSSTSPRRARSGAARSNSTSGLEAGPLAPATGPSTFRSISWSPWRATSPSGAGIWGVESIQTELAAARDSLQTVGTGPPAGQRRAGAHRAMGADLASA